MPTKPKTIMRTFKIHEISAVDRPAQQPAKAVLLKRDPFAKATMLTTAGGAPAHSHLLRTCQNVDGVEVEMKSGQTSYADGHFHPWIREESGKLTIGQSNGHTHDVNVVTKQGDDTMTPEEKAAFEKAQRDGELATKRAERAEKILALTPEQRALFGKKDPAAQDAFLALTPEQRAAEIAKSSEADPVVYTATDGTVFRKSDDARLIAMAKRNDDQAKELAKLATERANETLAKRAETELNHLPGDRDTKVALLKALDAVEPDQKTKVGELLKAANTGLSKAFEKAGTSAAQPGAGSPEAKLEELAKAHAAKKGIPYAKAYAEVLTTPEGAELYATHSASRDK